MGILEGKVVRMHSASGLAGVGGQRALTVLIHAAPSMRKYPCFCRRSHQFGTNAEAG